MFQVKVDQALMREVVARLVAATDPERIFLFGSRAWGTARPDSDLDLLVITNRPGPGRDLEVRAYASLRGLALPADILCYSEEQAREWSATPNHVVARALREGQLLYERRR